MLEVRRKRYEHGTNSHQPSIHPSPAESSDPWPDLHAEIARLPEKYRIPVALCYFEGLTHEQAAARLGWPVGTVKTRLTRARDQLRPRLRGRAWPMNALVPIEHLRPPDLVSVPRGICPMPPIKRPPGFSPPPARAWSILFRFWQLPGEFREPCS